MNQSLNLSFGLVLCFSCQKEINQEEPLATDSSVSSETHAQLAPYFATFEAEANARGYSFSTELTVLETHFSDIPQSGIAGQCSWSSHAPNTVTIDTPFWNNASTQTLEFVVFHELGHCVLTRGHDESQNNQGIYLSIMTSGTVSCTALYNDENREYYLNDLFPGNGS